MVHANGISAGLGVGIGVTGGTVGVGLGITKNQTALSKRASPPKMQGEQQGGLIVLGVITSIITLWVLVVAGFNGLFWIFFSGTVVSFALSQTSFVSNWDREARSRKEEWIETFMCEDCGHKFLPCKVQ